MNRAIGTKSRLGAVFRALRSRYGPQDWWPARTPFEVIVGAILTQNTAWTNVEKAVQNLRRRRLLKYSALRDARPEALQNAIRPSGTFRVKARRLREFIRHVEKHHRGNLRAFLNLPADRLRAELLSISGIGPETADSIALYAAHKPFFVVDAYTRRIFHRMGLLDGTTPYETIRAWFEKHLDRRADRYNEYHALIVRHAKETCRTRPRCSECCLEPTCAQRTA